jgi:hypothetical protein
MPILVIAILIVSIRCKTSPEKRTQDPDHRRGAPQAVRPETGTEDLQEGFCLQWQYCSQRRGW